MVANNYHDELIRRHQDYGVIIDTNLMILLLVGSYDESKIQLFRATNKYDISVYNILFYIVYKFRFRYTTPNIMTEVDNLSRQVRRSEWEPISVTFQFILAQFTELPTPTRSLAAHPLHPRIGVTDCSIVSAASQNLLVVTDDLPLTVELEKAGRNVVNLSRSIG